MKYRIKHMSQLEYNIMKNRNENTLYIIDIPDKVYEHQMYDQCVYKMKKLKLIDL